MTCEEYYAIVRRYGLRPSANVNHVYLTVAGDPVCVPDCHKQTAAQRRETIEEIKAILGITD